MKTDIHPTYYPEARVVCACGVEGMITRLDEGRDPRRGL